MYFYIIYDGMTSIQTLAHAKPKGKVRACRLPGFGWVMWVGGMWGMWVGVGHRGHCHCHCQCHVRRVRSIVVQFKRNMSCY